MKNCVCIFKYIMYENIVLRRKKMVLCKRKTCSKLIKILNK